MPKGDKKQEKKAAPSDGKKFIAVIVFTVIIVAVIAGGLVYGLNATTGTSITTFESNFDAAPHVAVVVYGANNTALSPAIDCASNLIEQLTSTHGSAHKDPTTISYFVMNQTSCSYTTTGLGSPSNSTSTAQCLKMSTSTPAIFINYSLVNKTVITTDTLYVSGDVRFMIQCGVASEITAGP